MARPRAPKVCAFPDCPELTASTYCHTHQPAPWAGTDRHRLPRGWTHRIVPRILRRDNHRCYRCGHWAGEVDHVIPWAEGGSDDDANLAAICTPCHKAKTAAEAANGRARARSARGGGVPG